MKVLKQEDAETRIVQKFDILVGYEIARQRKLFFFWGILSIWVKTAEHYTNAFDTLEEYIKRFDEDEERDHVLWGRKKQF
jgi:hypothetical protein